MKQILILLFVFFVFAHAVQAQTASEPVPAGATTIEADEALEWNQKAQTYTARGNAVATRGDANVRADKLTAFYNNKGEAGATTNGDITRMIAEGNVEITRLESKSYSDHAEYITATKILTLTGGNLRIVTPDYLVTAKNSIVYNDITGIGTANGEAAMMKGDRRLTGDVLTAHFDLVDGKRALKTLHADGNVTVTTPSEIIRGERGIYYTDTDKAIIEGNVKITRGPNQLNGDRAEIDNKTGISRLLATPSPSGKKPRIKALIFPKGAPTQ